MAAIQLQPPNPFDFKQPDEWPRWKRRFEHTGERQDYRGRRNPARSAPCYTAWAQKQGLLVKLKRAARTVQTVLAQMRRLGPLMQTFTTYPRAPLQRYNIVSVHSQHRKTVPSKAKPSKDTYPSLRSSHFAPRPSLAPVLDSKLVSDPP